VVAEGVDEVQLGVGPEDLAEHDRRRPLVDADLHDPSPTGRQLAQ
jgi:hypothetical protein